MKQLLAYSTAMLLVITLLASQCQDAVNNLLPDVNTEVGQDISVATTDSLANGDITLNPDSSADFRNNKSKLKYVTIPRVDFNTLSGTYPNDRTIINAELLFKHPDSTTYHSLGSVANTKLSQMEGGINFPATPDALNKLSSLVLNSSKGVTLNYRFRSDSRGLTFKGHVSVRLTLKLN
jgi:hypothetical protein